MRVVGIGGTTRAMSSTEAALRIALAGAAECGAETSLISSSMLAELPVFNPEGPVVTPAVSALLDAVRSADGIILASPGYHGAISGFVKNALDYLELLREDDRPYLDGRPVGCLGVAYGWQAAVNVLRQLRDVAHALRGWPTPLGVVVNSGEAKFVEGGCAEPLRTNLSLLGRQACSRIVIPSV
jgi:FMN reductase